MRMEWFKRALRPAAIACVVSLPLALLYARAVAEILIALTDALYLIHLLPRPNDKSFLVLFFKKGLLPFFCCSAAWCLWQILCSTEGTGGLVLSLVLFRLPLFALALGSWALAEPRARRAIWSAVAAAVAWIVLECWQQYLFGHNIFGAARWEDGALTGPFRRPRAGPELILTLFPVMLPASAWLLGARGRARRGAGVLAVALGAASVLLIGQRMPSALLVLGFILSGLLLPRLRAAMIVAAIIGAAILAASPFVAPAMYGKLIVHTHEQLSHFADSAYGQIWVRATVIAREHPWMGLGFDGFRRGCADPAAVQGLPLLGVSLAQARAATEACNIHPHNYYLEAADNGGLPLLVLFTAMVCTAGLVLARGRLDALRVGLLVGFVLAFWPLASTSAFTSMPNAGWVFLLLGLGFATSKEEKEAVLF